MNLKDNLKKGQAFIGIDNEKYYFLGYDYEEQILFTNLDLWTEKEQRYMIKNNLFIKEILNESSEIIENSAWYFQSKNELNNSLMEDKIKRCLDIIENSNSSDVTLKPIEIGSMVRGQAYNNQLNQYYELIGFIVDNNVYVDGKYKFQQKGFFPIYHSNCNDSVPLIFERGYSEFDNSFNGRKFIASTGDTVDILEKIESKEFINSIIDEKIKNRLDKNYLDDRTL